jgi:hypothetical protein
MLTCTYQEGEHHTSLRTEIQPSKIITEWTDLRRWLPLAVVLLAGFVALLDVTIVNVALAQVQWDLGARYEAIQWFVAGYALPFGFDHWGQTR